MSLPFLTVPRTSRFCRCCWLRRQERSTLPNAKASPPARSVWQPSTPRWLLKRSFQRRRRRCRRRSSPREIASRTRTGRPCCRRDSGSRAWSGQRRASSEKSIPVAIDEWKATAIRLPVPEQASHLMLGSCRRSGVSVSRAQGRALLRAVKTAEAVQVGQPSVPATASPVSQGPKSSGERRCRSSPHDSLAASPAVPEGT